jgi:hypothetical protein
MDVTFYCASYASPQGHRLHGSIFSSKNNPHRLQAVLFTENRDKTCGLEFWKAYRTRRDGEGQRQLSQAMDLAAHNAGFAKAGDNHTVYSFRPEKP